MDTGFISCNECKTIKPFSHYNIVKKEDNVQALINTCYECDLKTIMNFIKSRNYIIDADYERYRDVLLSTYFKYVCEIEMLLNVFDRIQNRDSILNTKVGLLPVTLYKINLFLASKDRENIKEQTQKYLLHMKDETFNEAVNALSNALYKINDYENYVRNCTNCKKEDENKYTVCNDCVKLYKEQITLE